MLGVFDGFLIHCKLDISVWDITFDLPENLLSGNQYSFGRDGKQDFFNLEAPGSRTGVKSNASFTFGALSRYSEGAYWIIEQCRGVDSWGLTKDHPLSRPEPET